MRDDIIDRLLRQVADINKQLKALQRLDVGGVSDHGALSGLSDNDHPQYALTANGVTNGDSHDHSGGDGAQIDHGGTGGLTDDDHTQYALLAGRSGGQTVYGGNAASNALVLYSTSNATKGVINMADVLYVDEVNDWVGVKQAAPQVPLHVGEGTDVPNATLADIQGYFTRNGNTSIVIRNATNNVELIVAAGSTAGVFGAVTNHDLRLRANNVDHVYISASGQVIVGALYSTAASGVLAVKAGTSSNDAAVGGVLYVTTTQTGNVGTGEDDLASYSVPANTLSANGMSLWFEASGTYAANTNSKVIRVRFGTSGTTLVFTAPTVAIGAGGVWVIRGRITRTGAATQKASTTFVPGVVTVNAFAGVTTSLNQTLSGAVTLKVTGEATSTGDIILESFIVGWDDANS